MTTKTNEKDLSTVFLFDVDGTLTPSRGKITPDMLSFLKKLRTRAIVAFVGGSDLEKQKEQIGEDLLDIFDYSFPENGLSFYKGNQLISKRKIIDELGESNYCKFVNFSLNYLSNIDLPIKRGTFIEYRDSMINISPIGRNCSQEERKEFKEYDKKYRIRNNMVDILKKEFSSSLNLHFSIGGEISIDCFPKGWDKTYCLQHIKSEGIKNIYFFGDMTHEGGNDYEIFIHDDVKGVNVEGPEDTKKKIEDILKQMEEK
ncbi:Phosphomannomutase [Spraguea lophii 42_110]|uniref:Phosphomannomutase n=1 Tax=Spraguea lophii (strain 42_110) TaxID=1358809 RepID=S7WA30_SPRLO|nr:Phosphomannomutase [Spraguea lophii 42_110]